MSEEINKNQTRELLQIIREIRTERDELKQQLDSQDRKSTERDQLLAEIAMQLSANSTKQRRSNETTKRSFSLFPKDLAGMITLGSMVVTLIITLVLNYINITKIPTIITGVNKHERNIYELQDDVLFMRYKLKDYLEHEGLSEQEYRRKKDALEHERQNSDIIR